MPIHPWIIRNPFCKNHQRLSSRPDVKCWMRLKSTSATIVYFWLIFWKIKNLQLIFDVDFLNLFEFMCFKISAYDTSTDKTFTHVIVVMKIISECWPWEDFRDNLCQYWFCVLSTFKFLFVVVHHGQDLQLHRCQQGSVHRQLG